ncbi:MAG TPA: hypothetical protein VFZ00_32720 [Solirubrobacter sp.]|jgi:hypothetical protein|nr:hypothetical protein [Solirubrobacter sp.]
MPSLVAAPRAAPLAVAVHLVSMQAACPAIFGHFVRMKDTMVDVLSRNTTALITDFWSRLQPSEMHKKRTLVNALAGWTLPPLQEADDEMETDESERRLMSSRRRAPPLRAESGCREPPSGSAP